MAQELHHLIDDVDDMKREFREMADDLEGEANDLVVALRTIADEARMEDGELVADEEVTLPFRDDDTELTFIVGMAVGTGMTAAENGEE